MDPLFFYDPLVLEHETGQHPEHPGRLTAVTDLLREQGWWRRLEHAPVEDAPVEALAAVHRPEYLQLLREAAAAGGGLLTADTPFGGRSWHAAVRASGAAVGATRAVLSGDARHAFALVRPPGHHAGSDFGMGFCLLNHVAVAARYARDAWNCRRVLVIDFDVHHGNGTEEIFYEDPSVFYFSMHQYPAYPGTGALRDMGQGEGLGTTLNVPLPAGTGDEGHLRVLREVLVPAALEYRPQLILVSAGYDSHWSNTAYLNSIRMRVTVSGFHAWVTLLRELADEVCDGRLAMALEGGYDPTALAWSVETTLRALCGEAHVDPLGPPRPATEPDPDELISECRRLHGLP